MTLSPPVKVLIVDDHDFFRRSIMLPLQEDARIEIAGMATDGDQAITLARSLRPDVILMDLNMPYISGLAAMERITPQEEAPAVLVLTGLADARTVMDAFAEGGKGFLRKDMITDEMLFNGIFTVPSTRMASELPHQLGCALEQGPVGTYLKVNELKETSVPGVFACGDTARGFSNVAMAVGDGAMTGASVHRSLVFDH